jgi:hypothetical protein
VNHYVYIDTYANVCFYTRVPSPTPPNTTFGVSSMKFKLLGLVVLMILAGTAFYTYRIKDRDAIPPGAVAGSENFEITEMCLKGVTYYLVSPRRGTSASRSLTRADDTEGRPIPCSLPTSE